MKADESRRGWKRCVCPIYASGTLNSGFKRKNTDRTAWEDAKAFALALESADSWARAIRCSGVIVSRLRLRFPPTFPPFRRISLMTAEMAFYDYSGR
jgi:hypothetical protein